MAKQKAELVGIMEAASRMGLNAILFQVRPACDALYASKLEPWSEYLTGRMGKGPEPLYDPLDFAIDQAHKRGLELHAWFNPYRARHAMAKSPISAGHVSRKQPELVRRYGRYLWLDPGDKRVQDYSLAVVMDVVERYDIDGVHFDDYFYPYPERGTSGEELEFPDSATWRRFGQGLGRGDWRRENVNTFIRRVCQSVKAAKPWVEFGVSPFGIWRPGYPSQIRGLDAYDKLYADARTWLANGWVDYLAPQLYWSIEAPGQSFPVLLEWWREQNKKGRHIWAGMNTVNVGRSWNAEEILSQIRLGRKQSTAPGHIHWNMSALRRANGLESMLARGAYQKGALAPSNPWTVSPIPERPKLAATVRRTGARASWDQRAGPVRQWVLQTRNGAAWTTEILPPTKSSWVWKTSRPEVIAISWVDRYGRLSSPCVVQLK